MVHALQEQASRLEHRPALWTLRGRTYVPTSWKEYAERVKRFALGLHALGFAPGGALGIMSFNREEWLVSDLAAMALGGVPVGLYTTSSVEQLQYILGHCEAEFLLVEHEKYLRTALSVREKLPRLRHIIVMDGPQQLPEGVLRYSDVMAKGTGVDEGPYWDSLNALRPEGLGTLIYTSGTTGHPKGVMLSHHNLVWTARQLVDSVYFGDPGEASILSYLPLSHIAEQVISLHGPLLLGAQVYFTESIDKMPENLREVRPSFFFGVPRVWEKFKARAEQSLASQPAARRRILEWARGVTADRNARTLRHERVPVLLEAQYQLARRVALDKLKARIGFENVEFFATAAAPIGRDVLEFFASLDIVIREVYGLSEVTGPATVNTLAETRLGSLGRPMMGVEMRIAEDGEILVRGGNVCQGYYKNPEATAELIQGEWMHSGDVGELDGEGFLRITGRKKEIIVTSGGKKTAPANIEALLKAVSPVGNAVVIGERRNFLVALLTLDAEKAPALAKEKGWPEDLAVLAQDARLQHHLQEQIEKHVNSQIARFESIKKFAVLPRDFTVEAGELTPSLKVRRKAVEEKYASSIEELYAHPGDDEGHAKAKAG